MPSARKPVEAGSLRRESFFDADNVTQREMVGLSESARRAIEATEVEQAKQLVMSDIYCAPSTVHGWGVFAGRNFRQGEILHESPGRLIEGMPDCITDDVFATTQVLWESEAGDTARQDFCRADERPVMSFALVHESRI